MGQIITAFIMIMVSIGPLSKGKTFEVKQNAAVSHPPENIIASLAPGIKKATITIEGDTRTAFYNRHNELIATSKVINIIDMDPVAIKMLIQNYPGYQMGQILKYEGDETIYFVDLKNEKTEFQVKITPDSIVSLSSYTPEI